MIAEGYYATKGIYKIIKDNSINMPIVKTVYEILYEGKNPAKAFEKMADCLD